ncbi:MAG: hypothetical protein H6965_13455 [Chromatiaceae bacterium]|nr:hypothetical protein [Chromatiaceae bacterium]
MIDADVVRLAILPPEKSDRKYQFRYLIDTPNQKTDLVSRLKREMKFHLKRVLLSIYPKLAKKLYGIRSFGYVAENFEIRHLEVWDSLYPFMHLLRGGGPIFGSSYTKCHFVFCYPVLQEVRNFYTERAGDYGLNLTVEGKTFDRVYDVTTNGNAMAFGGGKDSRLVYGVLKEIGCEPVLYNANPGSDEVPDLNVKRVKTLQYGITNRIMPAFMSLSRNIFLGNGLGEAHLYHPWQEYYEWAGTEPMKKFSAMMSTLGIEMEVFSPVAVLPYNVIQKILFERYPELYRYQYSVSPEDESEKNLHVALLEIYHGIDFSKHCSEALFRKLLKGFVDEQAANPESYGYRRLREVIRNEMRSIIYKMKDHRLFAEVKGSVPDSWNGDWIDYIHTYINPDIDSRILEIYSQYAKKIEDVLPPGEGYLPGYST